jgi:hypothetical protein
MRPLSPIYVACCLISGSVAGGEPPRVFKQVIGYPRSVVRPDGKVVTVYAFHDRAGSRREIEATIWNPGSR